MISGWERTTFPAVPGHEWSGTVDAVGLGVNPSLVGKLCVAENVLSDGGEVGFEHFGAYTEYLLTEASRLHVLPDEFLSTHANFPWSQLLHRDIELIGSNASAEAWPAAVRIATSVKKI